jgi:hypothetical protein
MAGLPGRRRGGGYFLPGVRPAGVRAGRVRGPGGRCRAAGGIAADTLSFFSRVSGFLPDPVPSVGSASAIRNHELDRLRF